MIAAILAIAVAVLMIWGGVSTLGGSNTVLLAVGAGVYLLVQIIELIAYRGLAFSFVLGFAAPVLIEVFLFNSQVRGWVRARGGRTL